MRHVPVLLNETIEMLALKPGSSVIDCTVGDGGHSEKILEATVPDGKLLAIDADPESLLRAKQHLYRFDGRVTFIRNNFAQLSEIVEEVKCGKVHGILADFGWSSPQFEERGRGFSFQKDEPLDMRYGADAQTRNPNTDIRNLTAADLLNEKSEEELAIIFKEYGEEKWSDAIAQAIVEARSKKRIERTDELVQIVLTVYREKLHSTKDVPWVGGLHPATKVFQALRMAVNDELGVIERFLPQAIDALASGGRLAVITFHSLEDRLVKHYFKDIDNKTIKIITKKAVTCGEVEYEANSRARSAKLRVIEKL